MPEENKPASLMLKQGTPVCTRNPNPSPTEDCPSDRLSVERTAFSMDYTTYCQYYVAQDDVQSAALWYQAEMNWCVVPARPGEKIPRVLWRPEFVPRPMGEEQVTKWWRKWPDSNICLLTGVRSNVVVADVDPRHGGRLETLWEMGWSQKTVICRSGSGGWHVYADCPIGGINGISEYATGIEFKADGQEVMLPPSVHPDGGIYEWLPGHAPHDMMPATLSDAILTDIRIRSRESVVTTRANVSNDQGFDIGATPEQVREVAIRRYKKALWKASFDNPERDHRSNVCFWLARQLQSLGMPGRDVLAWVQAFGEEVWP